MSKDATTPSSLTPKWEEGRDLAKQRAGSLSVCILSVVQEASGFKPSTEFVAAIEAVIFDALIGHGGAGHLAGFQSRDAEVQALREALREVIGHVDAFLLIPNVSMSPPVAQRFEECRAMLPVSEAEARAAARLDALLRGEPYTP